MKGVEKQHRSERSPQINSQGPLRPALLTFGDESNMVAEMAELEICRYPGTLLVVMQRLLNLQTK